MKRISAAVAALIVILLVADTAGLASQRPLPRAENSAFGLEGALIQGALVRGRAPAGTRSLTLDDRPVPMAPDGRFLIGLDRDAPTSGRLVAQLAEGREIAADLSIARRAWRIEQLGMARPIGGPTPEFQRLRDVELTRIAGARAQGSDSMGWAQHFIWPARGRLSGVFGSQRIYRGGVPAAYHSGIDLAAGAGAVVVAPADGVVTLAPPPMYSLEGNLVILDHGLGLSSAFLHLARVSVRPGQRVRQGEVIGTVGATGRATGPHLHWGLVWNGARIDPEQVVGQRR